MNDPHGLYESGIARGGGQSQIIDTTEELDHKSMGRIHCEIYRGQSGCTYPSNTSNTLNVFFYTDSGGGHVWQTGDGYQIHKLLVALDQPGRGQGDLIVGNPPINRRTGMPRGQIKRWNRPTRGTTYTRLTILR